MYSFPLWQQLETEKSSVGEISAFTMLSIAINNKIIINRYLHPSSFYISTYVHKGLQREYFTPVKSHLHMCLTDCGESLKQKYVIHLHMNMLVVLVKYFQYYLWKLRHSEKATKFERISHMFWQNGCFYSVASKQVGDFFKRLWPFQKSWTLCNLQNENGTYKLNTRTVHFIKFRFIIKH